MALVKLDALQEKVEETIHPGEVNLVKVRKNNSCESHIQHSLIIASMISHVGSHHYCR